MTFEDIPWKDPIMKTTTYYVFESPVPRTEGHVLFVPKQVCWEFLADCYKAAYMWGHGWTEDQFCQGFNIVQHVGEVAGQGVKYPCVQLIPRRTSDVNFEQGAELV
jgi:diadenosine tetraphosphate (Ap4A) HIT family hydrolase